ncbi:MAG TPA: cytochrome c7 [Geobacterales bacterium]|nr:cytochrome c7 [Geobacterales bacterium]
MVTMLALTLTLGLATAQAAEVMEFPASMGKVTFNHKKHQDTLKECSICHEKAPGKIDGFGKEWAHKNCKGCHGEKKAGPTSCGDCHKK